LRWRVVELETHNAYINMALDQAVMESVKLGESPPTLRFYRWLPSAVSIGYFQGLMEEVNLEECGKRGVDYVRRITGGGAVYHDYEGEVTYSVIAPEKLFPRDIRASYRVICGWIIEGLKELGIEGVFHPVNDILVEGRKISGNAQTRRDKVLLQHGTILYDLNLRRMFTLLKVSKEKLSDKMIKSAEERVTCVKNHSKAGVEDLAHALLSSFTEGKDWEVGAWSEGELERAAELVEQRYASREWNCWR
jgi:lipoate-protein ligase A